jgi:hypothetical protein
MNMTTLKSTIIMRFLGYSNHNITITAMRNSEVGVTAGQLLTQDSETAHSNGNKKEMQRLLKLCFIGYVTTWW